MKRILIIRLSAIGDVVMASGLIPALRELHPDAYLAWMVEPAAADLLKHNPRLDEVIVWPKNEWRRLWRERRLLELARKVHAFRRELRTRNFDLALDTQGLLKSGVWAWLSGAHERVGLRSREGSERLMTCVVAAGGDHPRMSSEYRALAAHLGAPEPAFRLDLAVGDEPARAVRDVLDRHGLTAGHAVLCPFTTRPQKHWFEDEWLRLAARLHAELGLPCLLLGGPDDREAGERIAAASNGAIVSLAGQLPLAQSVAVIAAAKLLVGVDTGLTHMGTALGIPTVALFGSTRPYLDAGTDMTQVMYSELECAPCRRHPTCGGAFTCMRLHTADAVFERARALLERAE